MTFTDAIRWYYTTESKHGLLHSTALGLILLLVSLLGWRLSEASSMFRGVAMAVSIGSLLFVLGGAIAGNRARKALPQKVAFYQSNAKEFLTQESSKVEEIHRGWFGIRVFWTMILLMAVVMLFLATKPFWFGTAVGILIIGTLGHIEEAISYQHNEHYRLAVQAKYNTTSR